ncbi:MAG TPA: cysteine dioxygenase family protein [Thermoanaerobaculia bacterium]|nr:cysteine dioxygenase family protein [Thermoanaerobaculia bacterium]
MSSSSAAVDVEPLIESLRAAVRLRDTAAIAAQIKDDLENFIPAEGLRLPERFRRTHADSYCRRLLYRDPDLGFTALVMTWGPGQRTALHDHAGIWCVEGVVEGELEVTRYHLLDETAGGLCRFEEKGSVRARAGSAGALIPPFEHHVLANVDPEHIALTLHVYGGEMDHCSAFVPEPDGRYRRQGKQLSYDD